MVMLFAMGMGFTVFGIVLGLAIAFGMALTITAVVTIAIMGKKMALAASAPHKTMAIYIESGIQMAAGLMVLGLGIIFLLAAV